MLASVRWHDRTEGEAQKAQAACLSSIGLPSVVARVLAARGVMPESLEFFFDPALARLARAADLPGIPAAVEVILPFVASRRKIVVFGDYDADGVCASAILVRTLRKLGGVADAFIPGRFTEGYGMTDASLKRLLEEHPDVALVITVDNGITAPREVEALKARGISVVVTDHHLPGPELPAPDALVNPRVASAPTVAEIPGPQTGVKGWAAKKAAIRDRLIAARDQGVTAAQLVTASEQKISDGEIYAILNAGKADMETYRRLEAALEALGR